jgi:hypothetical protein
MPREANVPYIDACVLEAAARLIHSARFLTAFTGAGISVESGIPPFRGEGGLWSRYDPRMLELGYFRAYPEKSWPILREIFYDHFGKARPNKAHQVLARPPLLTVLPRRMSRASRSSARAPRTPAGVIYHNHVENMVWVDALYMVPPFLAAAGQPAEAVRQVTGHVAVLLDPATWLYHVSACSRGQVRGNSKRWKRRQPSSWSGSQGERTVGTQTSKAHARAWSCPMRLEAAPSTGSEVDKIRRGVYPLLVARWEKVLDTVLRAASDANIDFGELCALLKALGFDERVRGDHYIFSKTGVPEIINIQPKSGKAKQYQVKQVRNLITKYRLGS